MRVCLLKNCKSRRKDHEGLPVSLFRFPKNEAMYNKWMLLCGNPHVFSKQKHLCSLHFDANDIVKRGRRLELKSTAVPKILSENRIGLIPRSPPPLRPMKTTVKNQVENVNMSAITAKSTLVGLRSFPCVPQEEKTPPPLIWDPKISEDNHEKSEENEEICEEVHEILEDNQEIFENNHKISQDNQSSGQRVKFERLAPLCKEKVVQLSEEMCVLIDKHAEAQRRCKELEEHNAQREQEHRRKIEQLERELDTYQQVCKRRYARINSLTVLTKRLKMVIQKGLDREALKSVDDSDAVTIRKTYTDDAVFAMLTRMVGGKKKMSYEDPHLRAFALALHFYSPAAYRYVRKKFNNALPSESTLGRWYSGTDGEAGFTEESYKTLQNLSLQKNRPLPVALMIDDMAIKKKLTLRGTTVSGFLDLGKDFSHLLRPRKGKTDKGTEATVGSTGLLRPAKEVCVFMVVCLDQSVKIPVGYFLHDKLTGEQLAELVRSCMKKLHTVGAVVKAIVTDGYSGNRRMAKLLGCNITPVRREWTPEGMGYLKKSEDFKTYFSHPSDSSTKVYFIADVCHMLKLVRNALASRKQLKDYNGNIVSWHHITRLHKIQQQEGVRLGNKLTDKHLNWFDNKQKVAIAAQTLSNSVATSLKFCEMLDISNFKLATHTAKFLSTFNNLFDILNSYKSNTYGLKMPMALWNEKNWSSVFDESFKYIIGLEIKEKQSQKFFSVFDDDRSVGFEGFLIAIESVRGLFSDLVRNGHMKFLLTYKLSQDHLESFFCKVRQRHGSDNNPTAVHFKGAYKRLLLGAEVSASNCANTLPQDTVPILNAVETNRNCRTAQEKKEEQREEIRNKHINSIVCLADHYSNSSELNLSCLSKFALATVSYVAGFVVKRLTSRTSCSLCKGALESITGIEDSGDFLNFIAFKSVKNGLTVPNKDTVTVCGLTELYLRKINSTTFSALSGKSSDINVEEVISKCITSEVYQYLFDHKHTNTNILYGKKDLMYDVAKAYNYIRVKHMCNIINDLNIKSFVRHKFNKLVLFNNQ